MLDKVWSLLVRPDRLSRNPQWVYLGAGLGTALSLGITIPLCDSPICMGVASVVGYLCGVVIGLNATAKMAEVMAALQRGLCFIGGLLCLLLMAELTYSAHATWPGPWFDAFAFLTSGAALLLVIAISPQTLDTRLGALLLGCYDVLLAIGAIGSFAMTGRVLDLVVAGWAAGTGIVFIRLKGEREITFASTFAAPRRRK